MNVSVKSSARPVLQPSQDGLWNSYTATGDIGIRNELVLKYIGLVEVIARKMQHIFAGKAQIEDIISNGTVALIKAVESFDPLMGVQFETYASKRIKGSVIDYIRSQDWIPRTAREKAKSIEEAFTELKERQGSDPSYEDIAKVLSISAEDVQKTLAQSQNYYVLSLDELLEEKMDSGKELGENAGGTPSSLLLKKELRKILAKAIDSLSEKERLVTALYYYEDLHINEIAKVLEISAARVCQLHSAALIKLKAKMKDY